MWATDHSFQLYVRSSILFVSYIDLRNLYRDIVRFGYINIDNLLFLQNCVRLYFTFESPYHVVLENVQKPGVTISLLAKSHTNLK